MLQREEGRFVVVDLPGPENLTGVKGRVV